MDGFMAICDRCGKYRECLRLPPLSPAIAAKFIDEGTLPDFGEKNSTLCCPCRVEQLKEAARMEHEYRMGL